MATSSGLAYGWIDQPDRRGTFDIIRSCLATIFLCSWSVLFLNIPSKAASRSFLWTKFKWVAFTIFYPEVLAAFAQQQWISASQSVEDFSRLGRPEWSLRHAFFADMGGFVLESSDYVPFPVDAHQMYYLIANDFMAYPDIDKEAIWDKNKANGFARVLTSMQVLWFVLQCLERAIQRLSMSTLELSTLAFTFCTLPTFFWWRHKPLDVATTIPVFLKDQVLIEDILRSAGDRANRPFKFTPLDFVNSNSSGFNILGPAMWGLHLLFGFGAEPKQGPITSFRDSARRPPGDVRLRDWVIITVVSSTYLSIHLIGWDFTFPTSFERQLWRSATVILLGSIETNWLIYITWSWQHSLICRILGMSDVDNGVEFLDRLHLWVQYLGAAIWIGLYGVARVYLIVEAFVSLRALPLATYRTVPWSDMLIHV